MTTTRCYGILEVRLRTPVLHHGEGTCLSQATLAEIVKNQLQFNIPPETIIQILKGQGYPEGEIRHTIATIQAGTNLNHVAAPPALPSDFTVHHPSATQSTHPSGEEGMTVSDRDPVTESTIHPSSSSLIIPAGAVSASIHAGIRTPSGNSNGTTAQAIPDQIRESSTPVDESRMPFLVRFFEGYLRFPTFLVLIALGCILTIRPALYLYRSVFPFIQTIDQSFESMVEESIPSDLEVRIENGRASVNKPEPYYLTLNKSLFNSLMSGQSPSERGNARIRVLTIDTRGSAENFEAYQSYSLLTDTSLVYYNEGNIQIRTLRDVQDMTVTRQFILESYQSLKDQLHFSTLITIAQNLAPLWLFLTFFFGQVLSHAVLAVILRILAAGIGLSLTNRQAFRLSVAIAVIPTVIWQGLGFAFRQSSSTYLMVVLGTSFLIIWQYRNMHHPRS